MSWRETSEKPCSLLQEAGNGQLQPVGVGTAAGLVRLRRVPKAGAKAGWSQPREGERGLAPEPYRIQHATSPRKQTSFYASVAPEGMVKETYCGVSFGGGGLLSKERVLDIVRICRK